MSIKNCEAIQKSCKDDKSNSCLVCVRLRERNQGLRYCQDFLFWGSSAGHDHQMTGSRIFFSDLRNRRSLWDVDWFESDRVLFWLCSHVSDLLILSSLNFCLRIPDVNRYSVDIYIYYMASSGSGQDEPNRALWLATRAGTSGQDGAILPARDYPLYPAWKISPKAI